VNIDIGPRFKFNFGDSEDRRSLQAFSLTQATRDGITAYGRPCKVFLGVITRYPELFDRSQIKHFERLSGDFKFINPR
jgi:hypothetical protein